jgi:hypothetical protein
MVEGGTFQTARTNDLSVNPEPSQMLHHAENVPENVQNVPEGLENAVCMYGAPGVAFYPYQCHARPK